MQMMNTGRRFVKTLAVALTLGLSAGVAASEVYFVDGYHGGIYGHYPVKWKTRFIVDQLQRNPDWKIGLEIEPETWDTVQVRTPEAYRDLAALLKSGDRVHQPHLRATLMLQYFGRKPYPPVCLWHRKTETTLP